MLRFVELLTVLVITVTLGGCQGVVLAPRESKPVVVHQPGPPSHAPAHGYRRKHQSGAELRFDSHLDVYIVVGHTDVYFHDGWFIRIRSGAWQVSAALDGPWEPKAAERVPPGLRSKHHAKKEKRPKERGRGAAKGAW
jgi:hypothetical protein